MADDEGPYSPHDEVDRLRRLLKDRSDALSRVQRERDLYREALVRVIALEPYEPDPSDGGPGAAILTHHEVHDAIGSDVIGYIHFVGPPMRWIAGIPTDAEAQRNWSETMKNAKLTVLPDEPAKFGRFAPWPTEELKPYLAAIDKAVKEIAEICDVPEYPVAVDRCPKCGSWQRDARLHVGGRPRLCSYDAWHVG